MHRSARAAYVAGILKLAGPDPSRLEPYNALAACVGCGDFTNLCCAACVEHDIFYRSLSGARYHGSPLCLECIQEEYCLVCYGRVRPHGFRQLINGVLGTMENGYCDDGETQEHGVLYTNAQ